MTKLGHTTLQGWVVYGLSFLLGGVGRKEEGIVGGNEGKVRMK